MRKAKKGEYITREEFFSAQDDQTEHLKWFTKDLIQASGKSLEKSLERNLEKKVERLIVENNTTLLDAMHEMLIKDRIEPLEKRVTKLEQANI